MIRSGKYEPFQVNDPEIYRELVSTLADYKEEHDLDNLRKAFPSALQTTLARYFGNHSSSVQAVEKNNLFYLQRSVVSSDKEGPIDLEDIRYEENDDGEKVKRSIGVCIEKSAVAQNLVSFLGAESYLISSNNCDLDQDSNDAHAFNINRTDKGDFILDLANPRLKVDDEDNVVGVSVGSYPLEEGEFEEIIKEGKEKTVTFGEIDADTGEIIPETEQEFVYAV